MGMRGRLRENTVRKMDGFHAVMIEIAADSSRVLLISGIYLPTLERSSS